MKNQKHIFNSMLLSYNRYVRKLKRLIANGLNFRKQEILEKRIGKLFKKISILHLSIKKVTVVTSAVGSFMLIQPNVVKAQNFDSEQLNPFGLTIIDRGYIKTTDFDNDGDFDIMSFSEATYSSGTENYYYENIGTPSIPFFGEPLVDPTWMPSGILPSCLADIDGDGDIDMFAKNNFYENIGSSSSPSFAPMQINPFAFDGKNLKFVDMDLDGDLDAFTIKQYSRFLTKLKFFENIGTSTNPIFSEGDLDAFSLNDATSNFGIDYFLVIDHFYSDFDNDGDIDILFTNYEGYGFLNVTTYYIENTGTIDQPDFESADIKNSVQIGLPYRPNLELIFSVPIALEAADFDNDSDKDLINLSHGNFIFYEGVDIDDCDSPYSLIATLKPNGYKLAWQAVEGSTKCEIKGGKVGGYQTSYTKYGNEPSGVFLNFNQIKPNRDYQWKVRCNCDSNEDFGPFSDYNYFSTGSYSNMNLAKSDNENLFAEESNIADSNVKLFPNPAKSSFNINTDLENYNVELRDVTGKLVYNQNNINQTSFNLDIKHVEAGTYFVKISNANSNEVVKLIVD